MKNKYRVLTLLALLALSSCGANPGSNNSTTSTTLPSTSVSVSTSKPNSSASTSVNSGYVEGNYQYFIQSDSSASRDFMRTPYIPNVTSSAPANYYQSADGKTGSTLLSALKAIIANANTSYDWSRYEYVDEDPYSSSDVFCLYVRDSYGKSAHVSGNAAYKWNREHTYPQSKLSGNADKDSNLIFADDWKTNGTRGNNRYGVVAHSSSTAVKDSAGRTTANYSGGNVFEPCDAAKGEVARATLYTYVMYNEPITDNFQSLALCLEWHNKFPVTSWEILRNNRNYTKQGNRNPFIDHPEYANMLF